MEGWFEVLSMRMLSTSPLKDANSQEEFTTPCLCSATLGVAQTCTQNLKQ